jgi:hypothetical protein
MVVFIVGRTSSNLPFLRYQFEENGQFSTYKSRKTLKYFFGGGGFIEIFYDLMIVMLMN